MLIYRDAGPWRLLVIHFVRISVPQRAQLGRAFPEIAKIPLNISPGMVFIG